MTIYNDYFLCGGVLCNLLADVMSGRGNARAYQKGIKSTNTEKSMMMKLSEILCGSPNNDNSFNTQKTEYKTCEGEGGWTLPFNEQPSIVGYTSRVEHQYRKALEDMRDFVDEFITEGKMLWLVKAALDILSKDKTIDDDTKFFVLPCGRLLAKKDILKMEEIQIEPFLIGMWYFILKERHGQNTKGKWTLEKIYKYETQRKHIYIGDGMRLDYPKAVKRWEEETEPEVISEVEEDVSAHQILEDKILESGNAFAHAWNQVLESIARNSGGGKENTFVDKQLNGNVTQVSMINSGNGNQAYIINGDFVDNRGGKDDGKE